MFPKILSFLLPLSSAIFVILLGVFTFLKNRSSQANIIFLLFSVAIFAWLLSTAMLFRSIDSDIALFWDKGAYIAVVFIPALVYHFGSVITNNKQLQKKMIILLGYVLAVIFSGLIAFTGLVIDDVYQYEWGMHSQARFLHHFLLLYFSGYLIMMFHVLYVAHRDATERMEKDRFKLIFIALIVLAFGSVGFLPAYNINIFPIGYLSGLIFAVIIAYTIIRYQFLEVKTFAAQALAIFISVITFLEIFISRSPIEYVLRICFFSIIAFAAYFIVRSVHAEVKRKDELQELTDKLARANDELRKLDVAKSEFISIASHQLRTPLTAIKGYISLILEGSYGEAPPKISDALNKVYLANERLIQLVEDLLNISRIESGRLEYKFEASDLAELLGELNDSFILRAREKGFTFDIDVPPSLPLVEMDYAKIREVISNLIDNAVKYTKKGGLGVRVEARGETVRITVFDTGIGIPEDVLPQLFNKFSRGDTDRLHADGTGLGLYVGKNLVEAHNGRIWAESDGSGRGSRFIVELPFKQPRQFLQKTK